MATRSPEVAIPSGTRLLQPEPPQFVTTDIVSGRAPEVTTKCASVTVTPEVTTRYATEAAKPSERTTKEPTVDSLLSRLTQTTTQNTRAPSSDSVRTTVATRAAASVLTKMPASETSRDTSASLNPATVVTKTPSTSLTTRMPTAAEMREAARIPAVTLPDLNDDAVPLPLPVKKEPTEASSPALDYKTTGLIALAAAAVIGGLVMWSGQSKGRTQSVARNATNDRRWLAGLSDSDLRRRLKLWRSHPTGVKTLIRLAESELAARKGLRARRNPKWKPIPGWKSYTSMRLKKGDPFTHSYNRGQYWLYVTHFPSGTEYVLRKETSGLISRKEVLRTSSLREVQNYVKG